MHKLKYAKEEHTLTQLGSLHRCVWESLTTLCRSCLLARLEALPSSCSSRRPKAEAIADTVSATPLTAAPAVLPALPLLAAPVMPLTAEVSVVEIKLTSVKVLLATCELLLLPRVLNEEAIDGTSTRNTSDTDCTTRSRSTQLATLATRNTDVCLLQGGGWGRRWTHEPEGDYEREASDHSLEAGLGLWENCELALTTAVASINKTLVVMISFADLECHSNFTRALQKPARSTLACKAICGRR